MDFIVNNYDWIVALLLLGLFYVQDKKIKLLKNRIDDLQGKVEK
jgi:hypothetical protein